MYIKNIVICNYKSFHGFNIIEDIIAGHNVIVGHNGAGKSVFLQAIDFLLRFENKQGSKGRIANFLSQRETKGFIEILLSGCDSPFENEITIRKEFSLITNIRFYVNGKQMDKKKMISLYEALSLNYTHSSFFMTPLMVQKFMKLSRKELFDYVFKNMGATLLKTYETIQKIFLVLEDQKEKIDNLLEIFQDVNTNDNNKYLMLLKKHKKIKNYIMAEISRKKIKQLNKMLIQLESELSSIKRINIDDSASSTVSFLQYSYSQTEAALNDKQSILNDLIEENCKLITKKEKINLSVQDIKKTIFLIKEGREETSYHSVESQAEEKIQCISEELDIVSKELTSKKDFLTELYLQKQLNEGIRLNLLSKIQRTKDFQSKEQRNSQLQVKIDLMTEQIQKIKGKINRLSIKKEELVYNRQLLDGQIENLKKQLQEQEESYDQNVFQAKQLLNNLLDFMCDIRREERILEDEISEISLNIQEKALQLKKKVGSAIIIGAESLLAVIEACKISQSHKWLSDSYYGMVIENFECPEELNIAVESVIGNRLFAHIVSNNKTGTNILKEINNHKLPGEILFLPIDNLIESSYNYPLFDGAEPILNKMKFKPTMEKVMKYLFGRVLICKHIKVAINIMRKTSGLICVTLEGDKISQSVMSGGYFNKSKCSMILFSGINHLQENSTLKTKELKNIQNKINDLEAKINRSISYNQQLKNKSSNSELKADLQKVIDKKVYASKELININAVIDNKKYSVRELIVSQRMLIEEMSEDFEEINEKINDEVMLLNNEIKDCENILHDKNLELTRLESKKLKLENDLNHQRKLKDLQGVDIFEMKTCLKKLEDYKVKEEIIDDRIKIITNKIEETEKTISKLNSEKLKLEEEIRGFSELDISIGSREKITKKITQYNNKISQYKAVYNKVQKSLRMSNEYSEFTLPMLYNKLKNVNQILKTVMENSETERRKKKIARLYKKYEPLYNGFTNNYVIYSHFVEWFHSYMEQCLNNFSDNFAQFFQSLTSGGDANLFMDSDESSESWPALENITGLQLCVQFSNSAVSWNLMDLSFSQLSLVALAFKFSVIKSFLIPIFMLDEIDRPLEDEQKKLVCQQIFNLSGSVQTFSTTHSQEWIKLGKEVYHVTFKYTGSNIKKITSAEVVHFLNERHVPVAESYSFGSEFDTISSGLV